MHLSWCRPRTRACLLGCLVAGATAGAPSDAAASDVSSIRECVQANAPRLSAVQTIALRTVDGDGLLEQRRIRILWRRDEGGGSRTIVRIDEPPDLAGVALLVVEPAVGLREAHLYLPAVGKTRRVRSAVGLAGLFGPGRLGLEDLDRLARLADRPGLLLVSALEKVAGRETWVVESRTADEPPHEERLIGYIDREHCVPLRLEVYENSTRPTIRVEAETGELMEAAHTRVPRTFRADDLVDGSHTTLTIEALQVDVSLPAELFTVEALAHPHPPGP